MYFVLRFLQGGTEVLVLPALTTGVQYVWLWVAPSDTSCIRCSDKGREVPTAAGAAPVDPWHGLALCLLSWVQVPTAYFNLGSSLCGLSVGHRWPFGHRTAEGLYLVWEVFCLAVGWGCRTLLSLLDVSLSQRLVQDWPGPSVPQLGFLSAWALGSEQFCTSGPPSWARGRVNSSPFLWGAAGWSPVKLLFQSSKWRACPSGITPSLTWDFIFFKANQWIWMSDSN